MNKIFHVLFVRKEKVEPILNGLEAFLLKVAHFEIEIVPINGIDRVRRKRLACRIVDRMDIAVIGVVAVGGGGGEIAPWNCQQIDHLVDMRPKFAERLVLSP